VSVFRSREPSRSDSDEPVVGYEELGRATRSQTLGAGTLACPTCDAPVALAGAVSPADVLACPFCLHHGLVRDFLSLGEPTRPAHVIVRIALRASGARAA
jgi:hypothetical protein